MAKGRKRSSKKGKKKDAVTAVKRGTDFVHRKRSLSKSLTYILLVLITLILLWAYISRGSSSSFFYQNVRNSTEVCHIGFLKVHKAGGSTVQNILFRFGLQRHLAQIIPKTVYKLSDYGKPPNQILENKNGEYYDILAVHSVYDKRLYTQLLPPDRVNIAIVREPLDLFISGAYYYRDVEHMAYLKKVPREHYIRNLILYPEIYDRTLFSWTRNSMAMDFGFPKDLHISDSHRMTQILQDLNKEFSLVMLTERFDQSLVLLKRLLNWSMQDILYVPINSHSHLNPGSQDLSDADIGKFESRNFLDVAIYKFFSGIFDQRVKEAGLDFQDEVMEFQKVLSIVQTFCCSSGDVMSDPLHVAGSRWNRPFSFTSGDCAFMFLKELQFIDLIRDKDTVGTPVEIPKDIMLENRQKTCKHFSLT